MPINWIPEEPQFRVFQLDYWSLFLYSKTFSRGEAFYFEILPDKPVDINLKEITHELDYVTVNRKIPVNSKAFGFNGIYVFPPDLEEPKNRFHWKVFKNKELISEVTFEVDVDLRKYPVSTSVLRFRKKKLTEEEEIAIQERIQREKAIKKNAFDEVLPNFITNELSHPRDYHYITSEWYKRRIYQYYEINGNKVRYYEPFQSIHRGLDLRGNIGDVVFAMANGKVTLSDDFYYEGNFIVINHGNRIFSAYMHLDKRLVEKNAYVKAGDKIGTVGNTGMSSGPHLHVSLWIDGFNTDPLSILYLPVR